MDALSAGDREVVDRLFNAAWREGWAEERRLRPSAGSDGAWATVRLPGGRELVAGVASIGAMDWVRTKSPYYVRPEAGADPEPVTSIAQVVELWDDGSSGYARFRDEVLQSAANLGSLLRAGGARAGSLPAGRGLIELAHGGRAAFEGLPPEAWLEGWILRGHPFHPGCKTRDGFDAEDLERYSPELGRELGARFVAVRRTHLVERRAPGAREDWPVRWREAIAWELGSRGLKAEEYGVLPAHPWQLRNVLPRVFARELADRIVVPLEFSAPVRPLVSLRTLVPSGEPGACHLKVPLAIQSTSAQRTVSAPSAENGPAFTAWIEAARADLLWAGDWELQGEERGLHFWDPGAGPRDAAALERARHLSFLCRRPPAARAGTRTVPAALLAEPSPIDGRPVVAELVERFGAGVGWFFHDYASLTLRAVLPLALREGVALEAHAQNCLVRLRDGAPVSVVLRDLGGLRVLPSWAGDAGRGIELHPGTLIKAETPRDLVAKLHHTWLHNHLAPLARALSDCGGVPETTLWAAARAAAQAVFDEAAASAPEGRAEALRGDFFAPLARVKALTRMRLSGKYFQYDFAEVPNPLHEA